MRNWSNAALLQLREVPMHIGSDSQAMLLKLNAMLEHARNKENATLYDEDGSMRLGWHISPLHARNAFQEDMTPAR